MMDFMTEELAEDLMRWQIKMHRLNGIYTMGAVCELVFGLNENSPELDEGANSWVPLLSMQYAKFATPMYKSMGLRVALLAPIATTEGNFVVFIRGVLGSEDANDGLMRTSTIDKGKFVVNNLLCTLSAVQIAGDAFDRKEQTQAHNLRAIEDCPGPVAGYLADQLNKEVNEQDIAHAFNTVIH